MPIKINPLISQEKLLALAKIRMKKYMPKNEQHIGIYDPEDKLNYFYFSGIYHIESELVTSEIIGDLQEGKALLSVGSGEGHLERLLVNGFQIPKERIHIVDKEINKKVADFGFKVHKFDMTESWPDLEFKYDYIIFPEALGVALSTKEHQLGLESDRKTYRFYDEVDKLVDNVKSGKSVRKEDVQFYLGLIKQDVPRAELAYKVIKNAFKYLSDNGEVRINGFNSGEQISSYVHLKLKEDFTSNSSSFGESTTVFRK
ncbi:hypothetical protein COU54_04020 [Candidatus Pacearchaeota archaeon CG10_big_fil_rev_8_21_14_0_10_31_24]|nr:MAG: hypothetical protein COU54_04020 [Candidatus Pacearchaeota archaeon CG10_big_fil_rev_8_21_14_0_10_31_24]